jgi:predicted GIY-YIG superfamily endonuclease
MAKARAREKKLKGICRTEKDALIRKKNPEWRDLYDEFIHPAK